MFISYQAEMQEKMDSNMQPIRMLTLSYIGSVKKKGGIHSMTAEIPNFDKIA